MILKKLAAAIPLLFIISCSSTALDPGAESVRILQQTPKGCKYLGEATGNQGNFITGGFTSNSNLETGARNDLKNKAHALGGNAVIFITNRSGVSGSHGGQQQTNVVDTASVYNCSEVILNSL